MEKFFEAARQHSLMNQPSLEDPFEGQFLSLLDNAPCNSFENNNPSGGVSNNLESSSLALNDSAPTSEIESLLEEDVVVGPSQLAVPFPEHTLPTSFASQRT
ncbi:unnamed protein product [Clavelina lepadiformis]|uniref:Uncharacterized protein n=1 Tax=Clavelina lepadiformis TaxID=159417 RepID=A0ABP0FNW1_CLALP